MGVFFNGNKDEVFMETATIGGFENTNSTNDFDAIFESAVNRLEDAHTVNFQRGFTDPNILKNDHIVADFKHDLLGPLQTDVAAIKARFEYADDNSSDDKFNGCGNVGSLYDRTSQLFDNKVQSFYESGQTTGQMEPVKTIDYPILVKENVSNFYKDIVNEEVTTSLIIKKQIEHHIVYSKKDPSKKWEYPMCLYDNDEFRKVMEEGKGTKLSSEPQALPLYGFDIVAKLTDVAVPTRKRITSAIEIDKVITADGDTVVLSTPMFVSQSDGAWLGGKIHQTYIKSDGTKAILDDVLSGFMDWFTGQTSLTSASNQIASVCFSGRLSNESNQNTIRHVYLRDGIEWRIDEGAKTDAAYTLEELQENKAMLNLDIYKKSYNDLCQLIVDIENFSGINFLDDEFTKYDSVELDPLYWNPMIQKTTFDCDSTIATTALPSEYLTTELKFHIDRFLISIADKTKLDNLRFVCWGNPRYVSLLQPQIKWIFNTGDRLGGVKLNYSYGVMTTGDTSVFVVSIKELNAKKYRGLRFIPFSTDKETITFKRFKFSTDVVTAKDTAYHDTEKPGGTQTYVFGTSRFTDVSLQGIQGELLFKNASFVEHLL